MAKTSIYTYLEDTVWDKKTFDKGMYDLLSMICFAYLEPVSKYCIGNEILYKGFSNYSEHVFQKIKESIVAARKAKTYDDFTNNLFSCIEFVKLKIEKIQSKTDVIHFPDEEPVLLTELKRDSVNIYNKYYKKKRSHYGKRTKRTGTKAKRRNSASSSRKR